MPAQTTAIGWAASLRGRVKKSRSVPADHAHRLGVVASDDRRLASARAQAAGAAAMLIVPLDSLSAACSPKLKQLAVGLDASASAGAGGDDTDEMRSIRAQVDGAIECSLERPGVGTRTD